MRLIYLSSGMHESGRFKPANIEADVRGVTYSDTKLHVLMLCKAVAIKWKDVYANTINPGWVPTKMGGPGAPDSLESGYQTQVWLAVSMDEKVQVSGCYFHHQKAIHSNPEADDVVLQEQLMDLCKQITGVSFPS